MTLFEPATIDGIGYLCIPARQIKTLAPGQTVRPCRGWGYTAAVCEGTRPVGWCDVEDLGYRTMRAWIDATGYIVTKEG